MLDSFHHILFKALFATLVILNFLPILIFFERKGMAMIQDRIGPNRAFIPGLGLRLAGLVFTLADVVKLLFKEDIAPRGVNRFYYRLAPVVALATAIAAGAVIPLAHPLEFGSGTLTLQALDAGVGILFILAASSLGVFAIVLSGWASNNKYSLLGALRASAQMISYEITMGLALVAAIMVFGSTDLNVMIGAQGGFAIGFLPDWGIFRQPVGFVLFLVAAFAETKRAPFDLAEAEAELVAGYHTEYSSIRFGLFYMAEYIHIVVVSMLLSVIFFGGWQIPYVSHAWLRDPGHAATVMRILLIAAIPAGLAIAWRLLVWHRTNRRIWHDERRREGAILAVLLGFAPAATAVLLLALWGGTLTDTGAAWITALLQFLAFLVKTLFFCWLFVWVRWTVPRFRYDQLMGLGWKVLIPLGLLNLLATGLLIKIGIW